MKRDGQLMSRDLNNISVYITRNIQQSLSRHCVVGGSGLWFRSEALQLLIVVNDVTLE